MSLLMSCKKSKMKRFPTIIEISASQLPVGTNLEDLTLIFGQEEIIDDNTDLKLHTVIQLEPFGYVDKYIETLDHGPYPNLFDISEITSPTWMIKEDDKISFIVEWDSNNEDIKPWKNEIKFILTNDNVDVWEADFSNHSEFVKKEGEISVKLKPKKIYNWDLVSNSITETGEKSNKNDTYFETEESGSSSGNSLSGKWMRTNSCTNSNNESTWFNFGSTTGQSFSADCNSACTGLGVKFYFSYTYTSNSILITWTSVDDYCGVSSDTPGPETLSYTLSGDILTINGQDYQKQ